MNVSRVVVFLAVAAATVAGVIVHHEAAITDEDQQPPTTTILATTEHSEHIALQTTENNTLQLTCHAPDDGDIEKIVWRTFPLDATAPIEEYHTHWQPQRNHTQTILHDDEARFPHSGEYFIDAVCETWNLHEQAQWTVRINR